MNEFGDSLLAKSVGAKFDRVAQRKKGCTHGN